MWWPSLVHQKFLATCSSRFKLHQPSQYVILSVIKMHQITIWRVFKTHLKDGESVIRDSIRVSPNTRSGHRDGKSHSYHSTSHPSASNWLLVCWITWELVEVPLFIYSFSPISTHLLVLPIANFNWSEIISHVNVCFPRKQIFAVSQKNICFLVNKYLSLFTAGPSAISCPDQSDCLPTGFNRLLSATKQRYFP